MKRVNVKGWHLIQFMARLKFHRVPDLIVSVGKKYHSQFRFRFPTERQQAFPHVVRLSLR